MEGLEDELSEEQKEYIKNFDILETDPIFLYKYIQKIWEHDCIYLRKVKNRNMYQVKMITLGSKRNEDIISALKENEYFFLLYHTGWKIGGYWEFELPIKV